jgi:hypothetical protein
MPASETLKFNPDDITIGDLEDFEEITGRSMDDVFAFDAGGKPTKVDVDSKTMKALVFIIKRQSDPSFTLEQARDVKLGALDVGDDESKADDPLSKPDAGSTHGKPRSGGRASGTSGATRRAGAS